MRITNKASAEESKEEKNKEEGDNRLWRRGERAKGVNGYGGGGWRYNGTEM